MKRKWKQIADYYGYEYQKNQTMEECSELIQALCKENRDPSVDDAPIDAEVREKILQEIADVQIMLHQMMYLMHCKDKVKRIMEQKLDRQLERMGLYDGNSL